MLRATCPKIVKCGPLDKQTKAIKTASRSICWTVHAVAADRSYLFSFEVLQGGRILCEKNLDKCVLMVI
jgi:hypothetical protein